MHGYLRLYVVLLTIALSPAAVAQGESPADVKTQLAQQFLAISGHGDAVRGAWLKQLELTWTFCKTEPCQKDLDAEISRILPALIAQHEHDYAGLLAARLSEADLRAAIAFAQSPAGQAVSRAELDASGELGALGHRFAVAARAEIARTFCSTHADVCRPAPPTAPADKSDEPK